MTEPSPEVGAEARRQRSGLLTGTGLNRRRSTIGVGIIGGGEIETAGGLRALMPPGVKKRTRVASPRLADLRQLQEDVDVHRRFTGSPSHGGCHPIDPDTTTSMTSANSSGSFHDPASRTTVATAP